MVFFARYTICSFRPAFCVFAGLAFLSPPAWATPYNPYERSDSAPAPMQLEQPRAEPMRITVPNPQNVQQASPPKVTRLIDTQRSNPYLQLAQPASAAVAAPVAVASPPTDTGAPSNGGLVKAFVSTLDATQSAVVAALPPELTSEAASRKALPSNPVANPYIAQVEPQVYTSQGVVIKRQQVRIQEPDVAPPKNLPAHLAEIIPAVTQETLASAEPQPAAQPQPSQTAAYAYYAASLESAAGEPKPLIDLPSGDAAAKPVQPAPAPAPVMAVVPAPAVAAQPTPVIVEVKDPPVPPVKIVATKAVKKSDKKTTAKKGKAAPIDMAELDEKEPPQAVLIVPQTSSNAPGLTAESKDILSDLPSNMGAKKAEKPQKLSVQRASEPNPIGTMASHEAIGIKIQVKTMKMDVNYELRKAYDAQMLGQHTNAIEIYKNILDNEPSNKAAMLGLAIAYHRAGVIDKARPLYGQVLAAEPQNKEALNNFMVLLASEAPQEAIAQLESLESRNPESSAIPAQMGIIYQKLGQPEKAIEKIMRAVQISPENLTYRYNLAIIFDAQKRFDQAGMLYQQLLAAYDRGEAIPGNAQKIQQRLTFIRSNRL